MAAVAMEVVKAVAMEVGMEAEDREAVWAVVAKVVAAMEEEETVVALAVGWAIGESTGGGGRLGISPAHLAINQAIPVAIEGVEDGLFIGAVVVREIIIASTTGNEIHAPTSVEVHITCAQAGNAQAIITDAAIKRDRGCH